MNNEIPSRKMYLEGGVIGFNPEYVKWLEELYKESVSLIKEISETTFDANTDILVKDFLTPTHQ